MGSKLKWVVIALYFVAAVVGCTPTSLQRVETDGSTEPTEQVIVPTGLPVSTALASGQMFTPADEEGLVVGCVDGGPGVFTSDDVRCYLGLFEARFVRELDGETAVLFTDPNSLAEWVGGAVIFHIPTVSTLVLDRFGDVDPQFSQINGRLGLVALSDLASNAGLMAELKQHVQQNWQTNTPNEPEVRISVAWQDGQTTFFLVAIAGIAAEDDRFYCPGETWRMGDETVEILADCIMREEGTLIRHVFFTAQEVKGHEEIPVSLALDGVESNEVMVKEGVVSVETAVYQTLVQHTGSASVLVRGDTISISPSWSSILGDAVDPPALDNFLTINQQTHSLQFLFQHSGVISVDPGWLIDQEYLPPTGSGPDCEQFRNTFTGLNGVISFSQIGFNENNTQAMVLMRHDCARSPLPESVYLLVQSGGTWQVIEKVSEPPTSSIPGLSFVDPAAGCGDIFTFKSNDDKSEFITFYIAASEFGLSNTPTILHLAETGEDMVVKIDLYGASVHTLGEFPYCNDVGPQAVPQTEWQAISGTATITISEGADTSPCVGEPYRATVRLDNVTFREGDTEVFLESVEFNDVTVGWCAG